MLLWRPPLQLDRPLPHQLSDHKKITTSLKVTHPPAGHVMKCLVDSGASHHMTPAKHLLDDFKPMSRKVEVATGLFIDAIGVGKMYVTATVNGNTIPFVLTDVWYVPHLKHTLISVKAFDRLGCWNITKNGCIRYFDEKDNDMFHAFSTECGYEPDWSILSPLVVKPKNTEVQASEQQDGFANVSYSTSESAALWHARLGHVDCRTIARMIEEGHITGIPIAAQHFLDCKTDDCSVCVQAKMANAPFPASKSATTECLELVHTDLVGPITPMSIGGGTYVLTILDDFTKYNTVCILKSKADAKLMLMKTLNEWETLTNCKVRKLRSDRGGEFINSILLEYFATKGIIHQQTIPYSHQQNGKAERHHRTLFDTTRALLLNSKLPTELWAEAVMYASHLHNVVLHKSIQCTPHQLFIGTVPDVSHLRVFGCLVYYKVPDELRKKLDPKSLHGFYLGPEPNSKGHRILVKNSAGKLIAKPVRYMVSVERYLLGGAMQSIEHEQVLTPETHTNVTAPELQAPLRVAEQLASDTLSHPPPGPSHAMALPPSVDGIFPGMGGLDQWPDEAMAVEQPISVGGDIAASYGSEDVRRGPGDGPDAGYRAVHAGDEDAGASGQPMHNEGTASKVMPVEANVPEMLGASDDQSPPPLADASERRYPLRDRTHKDPSWTPSATARPAARYGWISDVIDHTPFQGIQLDSNVMFDFDASCAEMVDTMWAHAVHVLSPEMDIPEPTSLSEALAGPHSARWREALLSEMISLRENHTWELVEMVPGMKVLPCSWVFKIKYDSEHIPVRFKCRLVAGGHRQKYGIDFDETFAPVSKGTTQKIFLSVAARRKWLVRQLDVSTAFLHGEVDALVYMQQPEGFEVGQNLVCKLTKCLYGLKQAPRAWYAKLTSHLSKMGLQRCTAEPSLWYGDTYGTRVFIVIVVDDTLITSASTEVTKAVEADILKVFPGTSSDASWYCGMKLNWMGGSVVLTQTSHIEQILKKHNLDTVHLSKHKA